METRRNEWDEDKYFTAEQVRSMALKNYNNPIPSGRWSTNYPKDYQMLSLVVVAQKLLDESKKSSEKSNTYNRETTKEEPAYIRYIPSWILEEPKGVVGNKNKYGK